MDAGPGSALLTLRTFYHTLRISIPTVMEGLIGHTSLARCDARLTDWAQTLVKITRTTLTVAGQHHIPKEPCIVMSNHLSLCDVPLLYAALPDGVRLRMIAKAELFRVPIWGRAMRHAGFIPIVRTDRSQAVASLEEAARDIRKGTFVWLAPEGTRSKTGALGPLKKGGFILATSTGLPILPVVIRGTDDVLPPTSLRTRFDQAVHIEFRPLIASTERSVEELMSDVRTALRPA
ncbi:MAG: lysophospholipid acyltransferase family protein [Polyangia bacterium]|jgi:1-acyl-sn-glycerol-3-phosphate acyltransferase